MIQGIVITHGTIGQALVDAAEKIIGTQLALDSFSVQNLSMKDVYEQLRGRIAELTKNDDVIILASLKGGSCWNAAVLVAREFPTVHVISGVNLPMLLSFVTKREQYDVNRLAQILQQDAVRGISGLHG